MWGTSLDHVLEVEVVTANGEIRIASQTKNEDLFWALRGAGASFGIITQFTVRTQPEPAKVLEYTYAFSFGKQKDLSPVFAEWQNVVLNPKLDRRFSTLFIAQPLGAIITGTFFGTREEYESTGIARKLPVGGFLELKVTDWLGSLVHMAEKTGLSLSHIPTEFYSKSLALRQQDALTRRTIDSLFEYTGSTDPGTLLWTMIFDSEGGAINDVPSDSTAYPHRDKLLMYQSYVIGLPLNAKAKQFADGIHNVIQTGSPHAKTRYAGYVDPELGRSDAQRTYWSDKLSRLQRIKAQWDPNDVFHNPQSIDPSHKLVMNHSEAR